MKTSNRYGSMDGLRGIAALNVVIFHFVDTYFPCLVPKEVSGTLWIAYTPLAVLYNGRFSVWVFFVLSGFVVSNSAAKRKLPLPVNLVSRYARLAIPVLAATVFAWSLYRVFPDTVHQLTVAIPHEFLYLIYNHDTPSFLSAVWHALYGVFVSGVSKFNLALWTMKIELIGSFGIYAVYGILKGKHRIGVLIVLMVLMFFVWQNYLGFAFGALLRELVVSGKLDRRWGWPAFVFSWLIGGEMFGWNDQSWLQGFAAFRFERAEHLVFTIGAFLMVYACLTLGWLERFMESNVPRFLGRISFGMYLIHIPLLFTVFVPLYLAHISLLLLLPLFLIFSMALGFGFTLLVDEPTLHIIKFGQEKYAEFRNRNSNSLPQLT